MSGNYNVPTVEAPVRSCPYDDCTTSNKRGYESDTSRGWEDHNLNRVECGDCNREYLVDHSGSDGEDLEETVRSLREEVEELRSSGTEEN